MPDLGKNGARTTSNFPMGTRIDLNKLGGNDFGQKATRIHINIDGLYTVCDEYGNCTVDFMMQGFSMSDKVTNVKTSSGGTVPAGAITVVF